MRWKFKYKMHLEYQIDNIKKRFSPRYIIIKISNIQKEDKILKTTREKR